jgi:hypothetical protein
MRLPSRSAAINSRSFHGLYSGPEMIFACAAFHCAKSSSTSALLPRLSQKKDRTYVAVGLSEGAIGEQQFPLEMAAMPRSSPAVEYRVCNSTPKNGTRAKPSAVGVYFGNIS